MYIAPFPATSITPNHTCSLPINHRSHVQKASGIISGKFFPFSSVSCPCFYVSLMSVTHSTVCFATGARNARFWNNSLHVWRNKTGHTALRIGNNCPVYSIRGSKCPAMYKDPSPWVLNVFLSQFGVLLFKTVFILLQLESLFFKVEWFEFSSLSL